MAAGVFTVHGRLSGSVVGNPLVLPQGPGGGSPSRGAKPACTKSMIWCELRSLLSLASDTVSTTCVMVGEMLQLQQGLDQLLA